MKISRLKEQALDGAQSPLVWKLAAGAAAVLVVALIAAWALTPSSPPPLDDDPIELARFVATPGFHALAEETKQPYMKVMRSQARALGQAFEDGQLTRDQYETAYLNGWMARQIDRMKDFYGQPESVRQRMLLARYMKKNKSPTPATTLPRPDEDTKEDFIDDRLATWTPEQRARWHVYRQAVKAAKKAASSKSG